MRKMAQVKEIYAGGVKAASAMEDLWQRKQNRKRAGKRPTSVCSVKAGPSAGQCN